MISSLESLRIHFNFICLFRLNYGFWLTPVFGLFVLAVNIRWTLLLAVGIVFMG